MPAKALIKVDVQIAILRELTAQGKGDAQTFREIEDLLTQRDELVRRIVVENAGKPPPSEE
jgi:hypothetical protein